MLVVLSPAKRLDWTAETPETFSYPEFQNDANTLADIARGLGVGELRRMMKLSDDLARLNHERFANFETRSDPERTKPAALAFAGDTYQGLQAEQLTKEDLAFAQEHVRILSGLYGLLRPLDLIQPYRLEMGSKLQNNLGRNLYAFWGDRLAKALDHQAKAIGSDAIINCASTEYFSAVDLKTLKTRVITPVVLEEKAGISKTVGFFAKKARGAFARYVVEKRITDTEGLKAFATDGYAFQSDQSSPDRWVFSRAYPEPANAKSRKTA